MPNPYSKAATAGLLIMSCTTSAWADEMSIQPGLYSTVTEVETHMGEMQLPARSDQSEECVTPEDIAQGPLGLLPETMGEDCNVDSYQVGGGKIDMRMSCKAPVGEGTLIGTGSYTEDSMNLEMRMEVKAQGMTMRMVARSQGQRIGDC